MRDYIIRRVLSNIPVLLVVISLVFLMIRLIPGDVVDLMLEEVQGTPEERAKLYAEIRRELGLDLPIHEQFLQYLGKMARGDFGTSVWTREPVLQRILVRLPVTIELGILAITISALLAFPMGIIAAVRQDTWVDYVTRVASVLALAAPNFWLATLAIIYPAIWWHYGPPVEYRAPWEDLAHNLSQLLVPAFVLGAASMGSVSRMIRSSLLEVIRQDYIRTAKAKGLRERAVLWRHALKNAMIPVITLMGLQFGIVVSGSVVMEGIFALPGMGNLIIDSIRRTDYTQLQANVLFISTWVLVVILLVDLAYAWLDPRIRYR